MAKTYTSQPQNDPYSPWLLTTAVCIFIPCSELGKVRIMLLSTIMLLLAYILKRLSHPIIPQLVRPLRGCRSFTKIALSKISTRKSFKDRIPPDSWDSHMHVVDPVNYPLAKDARYVPSQHSVLDALRFEESAGLRNVVLVQPSIYGNDNTCILDALRLLGREKARAVVAFDPETTSLSTLKKWNTLGVRGVRVNLQSVGRTMEPDELDALVHRYAELIRPLNWVLQLYVSLSIVPALERIVPDLGVKVCLDHFAHPALPQRPFPSSYSLSRDPYLLPGFRSLTNLLVQGNTFVKMSAPYRISKEVDFGDLEPVAKEILTVARGRVLFATDWPHTRFEGLDIQPFMEKVMDWCGQDERLIKRVFRDNAKDLWR